MRFSRTPTPCAVTSRNINLAKSKTSSRKPQTVAVPRAHNSEAVKAIEAWVELAGIQSGEPLLRRVHKGGTIGGRLHPQSVSKIVKARIKAHHENSNVPSARAHEDAARSSGHSLRVGFAVAAALPGADIRAIASVTRHQLAAEGAGSLRVLEPAPCGALPSQRHRRATRKKLHGRARAARCAKEGRLYV